MLLRQQGNTLQQIARELTSGDYRTHRGKKFEATAARSLQNRQIFLSGAL
ncbi:hypothetical protein [Hymenobacter canadensis]|uniref:Recombinase domain-containing protein n=1 Tax=Hymenobacter canadensis TaxID=2999067 RepID=A0ABY7LUU6_9BACT|nr:hypothetical protein [Hymenobacter canadensis]WBA44165.1 hypothetical protein O3303_19965 [Hymenobacter canadensis]